MGKWLNTQLEWFKSFFEEEAGKASNKRLLSTAVVAAYLFSYVRVSIESKIVQDISEGWIIMLCGLIGLNVIDAYIKLRTGETSKRVTTETTTTETK